MWASRFGHQCCMVWPHLFDSCQLSQIYHFLSRFFLFFLFRGKSRGPRQPRLSFIHYFLFFPFSVISFIPPLLSVLLFSFIFYFTSFLFFPFFLIFFLWLILLLSPCSFLFSLFSLCTLSTFFFCLCSFSFLLQHPVPALTFSNPFSFSSFSSPLFPYSPTSLNFQPSSSVSISCFFSASLSLFLPFFSAPMNCLICTRKNLRSSLIWLLIWGQKSFDYLRGHKI